MIFGRHSDIVENDIPKVQTFLETSPDFCSMGVGKYAIVTHSRSSFLGLQ